MNEIQLYEQALKDQVILTKHLEQLFPDKKIVKNIILMSNGFLGYKTIVSNYHEDEMSFYFFLHSDFKLYYRMDMEILKSKNFFNDLTSVLEELDKMTTIQKLY